MLNKVGPLGQGVEAQPKIATGAEHFNSLTHDNGMAASIGTLTFTLAKPSKHDYRNRQPKREASIQTFPNSDMLNIIKK